MADVSRVLVVGSGALGSQIAMVCALAGLGVAAFDIERRRCPGRPTVWPSGWNGTWPRAGCRRPTATLPSPG
jgi:glycine/D-amino acid oxidase-like deaminating enzyme